MAHQQFAFCHGRADRAAGPASGPSKAVQVQKVAADCGRLAARHFEVRPVIGSEEALTVTVDEPPPSRMLPWPTTDDADAGPSQRQAKSRGLRASGPTSLRHVGFIPDGNRRWAVAHGLIKEDGYAHGIDPGARLFERCRQLLIEEVSVYGFTQDNTRRPSAQTERFRAACVAFALEIERRGAALLVVGDERSPAFPHELKRFRRRQGSGIKVNFLVNYGWQWDLEGMRDGALRSAEVSRLDLVVRWGGGRRLSGFLPAQAVYADIYVVDALWPDFELRQFDEALAWYRRQDRTLGG